MRQTQNLGSVDMESEASYIKQAYININCRGVKAREVILESQHAARQGGSISQERGDKHTPGSQ